MSSPEPPTRKADDIPEPMVQLLTCRCLHVVPVVDGVAICVHERYEAGARITQEIRYRVSIVEELAGGEMEL